MEYLSKFLPLYLGQKFRYRYVDWEKDSWSPWTILNGRDIDKIQDLSIDKIQLQLRPLSSMTEEEAIEIGWGSALAFNAWIKAINQSNNQAVFSIYQFKKLLEWGFDIFGLKEKGFALYPEDIKE